MNPFYLIAILALSASAHAADSKELEAGCSTAKEFIVTLEFLRDHKDFGMTPEQSHKLALNVASGCTGASLRYMRIVKVLTAGGLPFAESSHSALEMSKRPDAEADAFLAVFERAYLKEYMDLDLRASLTLARSLSTEFKGDRISAREDFGALLDHCSRSKGLDLSPTDCGYLAARVIRNNERFGGKVTDAFIKIYDFVRDDSRGPRLSNREAAKLAEEVLRKGPMSADNFISGYRYSVSQMAMGGKDALEFATQLAR